MLNITQNYFSTDEYRILPNTAHHACYTIWAKCGVWYEAGHSNGLPKTVYHTKIIDEQYVLHLKS